MSKAIALAISPVISALAGSLLLGSCVQQAAPAKTYDPHPEKPSIMRDVAMISDDVEFTHPYVPGLRTTMDGRIGLRVQGAGTAGGSGADTSVGTPGHALRYQLSFSLFTPETLTASIADGPNGVQIMADTTSVDVTFPPAFEEEVYGFGHHAICDATEEFYRPGEKPNPRICANNPSNDCYEFTVISTVDISFKVQLYGTPVSIEVENPKTPNAKIVKATLGTPVKGIVVEDTLELDEPAVTIDGRLLTGRFGGFPRDWVHPQTGELFNRPYDLMYSVLTADAEPCDVTGWTQFHPMSHAPFDPNLQGKYGIANYQFRDTEGKPIADGEDVGGTYPWVDREGANLFMTAVHGRIAEQSKTLYPRRCVVAGCDDYDENVDRDRGFMVAGAWTHGKFVHLDGILNNLDWAVGVTPSMHYWVDLYKDEAGTAVPVRVGSGRFIEEFRGAGPYPEGYPHNPNILDSIEHLFNYNEAAQTVTPRDVVWLMSTGVATDEIDFDDLLDPHAFILSNMWASTTQYYLENGQPSGVPRNWNGQVRDMLGQTAIVPLLVLRPDQFEEIHIQNGATTLLRPVPAYGLVAAGTGRTEPVALGGIKGRGFWLSGDNAIVYDIPAQPEGSEPNAWYVGIFVDVRIADEAPRALLTFPDGTQMKLAGADTLLYQRDGSNIHEVELPAATGYRHLGFQIRNAHREITLLVNGMAYDKFKPGKALFQIQAGDLIVGSTANNLGARGWIDNFHVLARDVDPEVACNQAFGTLARVEAAAPNAFVAQASLHPDWAHSLVAGAAADPAASQYVCYTDYSRDYGAHLKNIPAGLVSVRQAIHFPEGPLKVGVPRPDSSDNQFCLSCHYDQGKGGMSLAALEYKADVLLENDHRRQPLQPPRRVFGNIPANWIPAGQGPGSPNQALQAPSEGALIDFWVLAGE